MDELPRVEFLATLGRLIDLCIWIDVCLTEHWQERWASPQSLGSAGDPEGPMLLPAVPMQVEMTRRRLSHKEKACWHSGGLFLLWGDGAFCLDLSPKRSSRLIAGKLVSLALLEGLGLGQVPRPSILQKNLFHCKVTRFTLASPTLLMTSGHA